MQQTIAFAVLALASSGLVGLHAQPAIEVAPSTRATSEVSIAYRSDSATQRPTVKRIRLDYGQPHLRGRTLHTDSLVPYDKVWRTGANAATTLHTDVDLVVGGAELASGTYVLFTLPSRAGWTLIVQRSPETPSNEYDASRDLVRIDLRHRALPEPAESLTMTLIPSLSSGMPRGELRLTWGLDELSADWAVR